ncbi:Thioesterase superfamily [Corchorus capsularis]|uniref:Acyl-coenzyme A thioesterase 13 n=2 Tax=Corchorus TaxID=93758 RepID=A0A1R3G7I6_COCAP|nr:Thioesterase superfamily [Corchorus capsularis]OMO66676.1 Thioesterase superfamily [Corchorus olitorius]
MEEEINFLERSLKWLEDVTTGAIGYEIESRTLQGLQVVRFVPGFVRCHFTVPIHASDVNGNWHVGAIATLIDNVGGAAIYTISDRVKVTVNFNISYYSTAKIQDEVEIEAKVLANKGKLTSAVVEIRRKDNGELVAIGKQWTASNDYRAPQAKL